MSRGSIYTLRHHSGKFIEDYMIGLEKAVFSKAQLFQIEWPIAGQIAISQLIDEATKHNLQVAIKCSPESIWEAKKQVSDAIPLHVFFENFLGVSINSELLSKKDMYVLQGNRKTDFEKVVKFFSQDLDKKLRFSFSPYDGDNPDSLSVHEIAKVLRGIQSRYPDFEIKNFEGYEPFDFRLGNKYELEPLLKVPDFEVKASSLEQPKLTIIIPTFNSKFLLLNVLRHLFNQDVSPDYFEVIVVDDGSTDNTKAFLQSYIRSEKSTHNFKYFYWPKPEKTDPSFFRAGLSRNLGANHARGEHLLFLDSDILVPPDFLKNLSLNLKNYDVVQYVRHHIKPEKSHAVTSYQDIQKEDLYIEEADYWGPFFKTSSWMQMDFYWKYTCTYCLAMKKSDFFKAGRFKRLFVSYGFEDTDLGYRLHKMGCKFHLSLLPTLHLTIDKSSKNNILSRVDRFNALSKTAKIFYLLNLDRNIYHHFKNYLGGEISLVKLLNYSLGKFFKKSSKKLMNSEMRFLEK